MRKYQQSHPWITFDFRLGDPGQDFWLLLGEASSKCAHLARVPLRPETAWKLYQLYLAKGIAATTAIEGNTLSEAEVLQALEGKLEVMPSKEYLKQEVDNVIAICREMGQQLVAGTLPELSWPLISHYNSGVLHGLPAKEDVVPGQVRTVSVVVGKVYRGPPPEECEYLLDRMCTWLNGPAFQAPKGKEIVTAILKAVVAHVYLAWIHPFGDGNGRTARMIEFHLLLAAGVPAPAAHLLSNHYNETRPQYYAELDRASKSGGDLRPFLLYAVQGLVDGLRKQLDYVWEEIYDVTWRNYVYELFRRKESESKRQKEGVGDSRQKHIALELGVRRDWVDVSEIPVLTTKLAREYATQSPKTVQRDLHQLLEMKLIVREDRKIRANRELVYAFLPAQKVK